MKDNAIKNMSFEFSLQVISLYQKLIEEKENARSRAHEALCNELFGREDRRHSYSIDTRIKMLTKVTKKDLKAVHEAFQKGEWVYTIAAAPAVAALPGPANAPISTGRCSA